jgi:hypothetical protein
MNYMLINIKTTLLWESPNPGSRRKVRKTHKITRPTSKLLAKRLGT